MPTLTGDFEQDAQAVLMTRLISGYSTRSRMSLYVQGRLLRAFPESKPYVMAARAEWLAWVTKTQREWQRASRRPQRANHGAESVATRERYVRCQYEA